MTSQLAQVLATLVIMTGSGEGQSGESSNAHIAPIEADAYRENYKDKAMSKSDKSKSRRASASVSITSGVLAAITGSCLIASCSGVRVLADGTAACSSEAIAETKRMKIPPNSYFSVEILGLPGSVGDVALLKEGPVEVRVTGPVYAYVPDEIAKSPLCTSHGPNWVVPPECKGETIVTGSALLYGEASFKGERVQIRLHQLRDRGVIGPFCGVIAQRRSLYTVGLEKNPPEAVRMLRPGVLPTGTVAVWSDAEVLVIEDTSQKPRL